MKLYVTTSLVLVCLWCLLGKEGGEFQSCQLKGSIAFYLIAQEQDRIGGGPTT